MNTIKIIGFGLILTVLASCSVVRQGEVGVKRKMGKLDQEIITPGAVGFNPFVTRVIKMPIRTMNMEISTNLPSQEGLNVQAVISILYSVQPEKVPLIVEQIGIGNERGVISSVFRSSAADVCSQYYAKDMHSAQRSNIEAAITNRMNNILSPRGFEIEAVLMKNIALPAGLARAVEDKLEAEQNAQRMKFLLDREKLEAERKIIEAKGIRDAQRIISEGLTNEIIQWQSIEAFKELSKSPNTKVIMTDGQSPMLVDPSGR